MARFDSRRRAERQAFTLMEVLLVLVILVVLGSLAVGVYSGIRKTALKQAAQVQVDALSASCDLYNATMQQYPAQLQDLRVRPSVPNADAWPSPFIDHDVGLDPWNQEYHYALVGPRHNGEKPDISSDGPPGENTPIYNH